MQGEENVDVVVKPAAPSMTSDQLIAMYKRAVHKYATVGEVAGFWAAQFVPAMLFFALPWCVACVIDDAYFVKWLIPVHVGAAVLCQLVCGYIYMQYLAQNHCFGLFGPLVGVDYHGLVQGSILAVVCGAVMNFFFFFTEATAPRGATAATFVTWTKLFVIGAVLSAGLVMLALVLYVHSTLIKSAREKYIKDALSGRAPPDDCHPLAAAGGFEMDCARCK